MVKSLIKVVLGHQPLLPVFSSLSCFWRVLRNQSKIRANNLQSKINSQTKGGYGSQDEE